MRRGMLGVASVVILFGTSVVAHAQEGPRGFVAEAPEWAQPQDALRRVIETHPSSAIRDTLDVFIRSGVVLLNFEPGLSLGGEGDASIFVLEVEGVGLRIVLNIEPDILADSAEVTTAYRVVYHEYVHIQQLLSGRAPVERFLLQSVESALTWQELYAVLQDECEAYTAEGALAHRMQWHTEGDLASAYALGGHRAVWQRLLEVYAEEPRYAAFRDSLLVHAHRAPKFMASMTP